MPHMLHAWMLDPAGRRNLWCFSIFLCHGHSATPKERVEKLFLCTSLTILKPREMFLEGDRRKKDQSALERRPFTHRFCSEEFFIHLASLSFTHHGQRACTLNDIVLFSNATQLRYDDSAFVATGRILSFFNTRAQEPFHLRETTFSSRSLAIGEISGN